MPAHSGALNTEAGTTEPHPGNSPQTQPEAFQTATPEELGLKSEPLELITQAVWRGDYPNVHSVLILKENYLVYEQYFEGTDRRWNRESKIDWVSLKFDRNTLHDTRSAGKSITSALVGIAVEAGYIESVQKSIFDFFPEYAAQLTAAKREIKIEHLLTMSAGLDWNESDVPYTNPANHEIQMEDSDDPAGFVLGRPVVARPGSTFYYNSGLPTLVGYIVSRASGVSFGDFARAHLFEPLDMQGIEWGGCCNPKSPPEFAWEGEAPWARAAVPGGSLWIRPIDLLKFGSLFLNQGQWNGKEILSSEWVTRSLAPLVSVSDADLHYGKDATSAVSYGYFWWHYQFKLPYGELTVHAAQGNGGQRVWVIPSLDLVVVHMTGNYNIDGAGWRADRLLLERIVPWAKGIDTDYRHSRGLPAYPVEPASAIRKLEDPERYVGLWQQSGREVREVEVTIQDGSLFMIQGEFGGWNLIPEAENVFSFGVISEGRLTKRFVPDIRIVFIPDEAGSFTRYELRRHGENKALVVAERLE